MKKILALVLALCLTAGVLTFACAAGNNLTLSDIGVSCTIPEGYILLTRTNLEEHQEWLTNHGFTSESLLGEWSKSGTYAQAFSTDDDSVCISITAVVDDFASRYFDLDQQTPTERAAFRKAHKNGTSGYGDDGYTYSYAEWKNNDVYGRFLQLEYKQKTADGTYWGIARRAVRNGYTITLDYRVSGRKTNTRDTKVVNAIMATWNFIAAKAVPQQAAGKTADGEANAPYEGTVSPIAITTYPAEETNTGKIKVAGSCTPGQQVIATFMCMSAADPVNQETASDSKGRFSFSQTLPKEGVWLTTITVQNGDEVLNEVVLNTTTYRATLLPVNFDDAVPLRLYESVPANAEDQLLQSDTTVISGTTMAGVTIQFFVNGEKIKETTTNNNATFSFKFDSSAEGNYEITLAFAKKKMSSRRFTCTAKRELTEEDIQRQTKDAAVKPAYSTLKEKLTKYTGKILGYSMYVADISTNGKDYVYTMAMTKTKSGTYKNLIVVTSSDDLAFEIGEKHTVYGKCIGNYELQSEEGTEKLPGIEAIFVEE